MTTAIKLSDLLVSDAKSQAQIMHRSTSQQIEYWARLGKAMEDNPDLPVCMLQDMLASIQEVNASNLNPYKDDCLQSISSTLNPLLNPMRIAEHHPRGTT